jgi:hypothetical protein
VVVCMVLAQVQVHECGHVHSVAVIFHVKQVCWNDVEMGGVEWEKLLEAFRGIAKVA